MPVFSRSSGTAKMVAADERPTDRETASRLIDTERQRGGKLSIIECIYDERLSIQKFHRPCSCKEKRKYFGGRNNIASFGVKLG